MNTLGQRIAEERERLGITRAALARRVGVSDVSVHYWERGIIQQIGHRNLLALGRVFGITVSELLDDGVLEEREAERRHLGTPTTSLARRDLLQQAEALEEAASGMTFDARTKWMLQQLAGQKRQQAEGGE